MTQPTGKVIAILAVSKDGKIGDRKNPHGNNFPWPSIAEDMRHFKATTLGKTLIMGRKTWETIPEQVQENMLENRFVILLTRNENNGQPKQNLVHVNNVSAAFSVVEHSRPDHILSTDIFICGGVEIYELFWPYCTKAIITTVEEMYPEADVTLSIKVKNLDWTVIGETVRHESKTVNRGGKDVVIPAISIQAWIKEK